MKYVVELLFDPQSERAIHALWDKLSEQSLPSGLRDHHIRPHITLAVYDKLEVNVAEQYLSELCTWLKPFSVLLNTLGTFYSPDNVIFTAPVYSDDLRNVHVAFHKTFAQFVPCTHPHHVPKNWQPHCTLAIHLSDPQFLKTFNIIRQEFHPLEVTIETVALYKYDPQELVFEQTLLYQRNCHEWGATRHDEKG